MLMCKAASFKAYLMMSIFTGIFRIRAGEPLDIPRILSENTVCEDNLLKLVISLPQNPGDDSFVTVDELIKSAFSCRGTEIESSRIATALEDKVYYITFGNHHRKIHVAELLDISQLLDIYMYDILLIIRRLQVVQIGNLHSLSYFHVAQ